MWPGGVDTENLLLQPIPDLDLLIIWIEVGTSPLPLAVVSFPSLLSFLESAPIAVLFL